MVKMIVTDLDGTLLRTDKTISDYSKSVLKRCREKGHKIVFATARSLHNLQVTGYIDEVPTDSLVVTNGAFVYADRNLIYEGTLPRDVTESLLTELNGSPEVTSIGARTRERKYSSNPNPQIKTESYHDFRTPLSETISHISFHTENASYAKSIITKYPQLVIYHVSAESFCDVNPRNCTKATEVKILAEHYNTTLSVVIAFGDDNNDIDMLRECGTGVAVANAIDEAKAASDYICDTNDNDGVARWLEENIQ